MLTITSRPRIITLAIMAFFLLATVVSSEAKSKSSEVDLDVPDLVLTDQNGEEGRLITDFIRDKRVAITFTFTSCTTICPVLDGIFRTVQKRLGKNPDKDIALLTISIDPDNDIPARLNAHAKKLHAAPYWKFLTGDRDTITTILRAMEVYTTDIVNHPPAVFIVNGKRLNWKRFYGFPSSRRIIKGLENAS